MSSVEPTKESKEHPLLEILAAKQYPQVYRVTRSYHTNQRECLKKGQILTVLDRRKVNLVVGVDQEGREFYVREDRSSTNVEVIEEERVVNSLSAIVQFAKHLEGIEFRKEVRLEKQIFEIGEVFTIDKVNKDFRGKPKTIALRRNLDGKVYRFPQDMIGIFRLLAGKSVLPLSKILSLRVPPITVQFHNTPTSSNFPRGEVTLRKVIVCDVVYVLTVRSEVYTYEAFHADPKIHLERCPLKLPLPIVKIIPDNIHVNSQAYIDPIKKNYKHKISEIESNLVEDIYAVTYYGSATFDKPADKDTHLISGTSRFSIGSLPLSLPLSPVTDEKVETVSLSSNAPSTPESEQGDAPLPKPRYSKKPRPRVPFHTIMESDQAQNTKAHEATANTKNKKMEDIRSLDELKAAIDNMSSLDNMGYDSFDQNLIRNFNSWDAMYGSSINISGGSGSKDGANVGRIRLSNKSNSCTNITTMNWQTESVFYSPESLQPETEGLGYERSQSMNTSRRGSGTTSSTGRNSPTSSVSSTERQSPSNLSLPLKPIELQSNERHSPMSGDRPLPVHSFYRSQSPGRNSPRIYDTVTSNRSNSSWCSSVVTEDSGDSGVNLQYSSTRYSSPTTSQLSSPSSDANPLYATLENADYPALPPPLPARENTYQNIRNIQADLDNASTISTITEDEKYTEVSDVIPHYRSCSFEGTPYTNTNARRESAHTQSFRSNSSVASGPPSVSGAPPLCRKTSTQHPRYRGIDHITAMSRSDVGRLLVDLRLESFIESFKVELIDGKLLVELNEPTLVSDIHMSRIQAHKLIMYVQGWRPILRDPRADERDPLPLQITTWSVNNVFSELQKINLSKLGHFCKENLIDGQLLVDLVENDFLGTLKTDHNISLSRIELSRLTAFVLKDWRPDNDVDSLTSVTSVTDLDVENAATQGKKYKQLWNRLTMPPT